MLVDFRCLANWSSGIFGSCCAPSFLPIVWVNLFQQQSDNVGNGETPDLAGKEGHVHRFVGTQHPSVPINNRPGCIQVPALESGMVPNSLDEKLCDTQVRTLFIRIEARKSHVGAVR